MEKIIPIKESHSEPLDLEKGLELLKEVVSKQIQAYLAGDYFDAASWLAQHHLQARNERLFSAIPMLKQPQEWLILMTALAPHVQTNFFESIVMAHLPNGGDFPEFGGVKGSSHRGMLPTGETIQFILGGNKVAERLQTHQYFSEEHFFFHDNMLWLEPVREGEPRMSGRVVLTHEWVDQLLFQKESAPRFGLDFPAKKLFSSMVWDDVVLHPHTQNQVNDLMIWLKHHHHLHEDANLQRKIKPGLRVLFYGPSGTGKTLTAALLGKQFQKDVYRIDLSQIVSKYIGETEQNLEKVFHRAETKNWILFFDEADALFGKRTNVQSAHDKYANQEVSYLLQRVEDYPGLMILASNFKSNLDEAFIRRFHSVVHFPMPNNDERLELWKKSMPSGLDQDCCVNLEFLATNYEMSGASILNAVQFSALQVYARSGTAITQDDLLTGIRKEFMKEEKSM